MKSLIFYGVLFLIAVVTFFLLGFISNRLASYHRGAVLIESGTSEAYNVGSLFSVNSTSEFSLPFPRMTEDERLALTGLVQGAMVYQTNNTEGLYIYKSSGWTFVIKVVE